MVNKRHGVVLYSIAQAAILCKYLFGLSIWVMVSCFFYTVIRSVPVGINHILPRNKTGNKHPGMEDMEFVLFQVSNRYLLA